MNVTANTLTNTKILRALRALDKADRRGDIALAEVAGLAAEVRAALPRAPRVPFWGMLLAQASPETLERWKGTGG
jgi:hypothetical protein